MTDKKPIDRQKDKKKSKKLTWEATLNIRTNKSATEALTDIVSTTPAKTMVYYMPPATVYLTIDNKPILGHIEHAVTTAWTLPDLLKHMYRKYGWIKAMFQSVDYTKLCQVYKQHKKPTQHFIT
eukprot:9847843-Ditylum_brightwellii.AAC.1